MDERKKEPIGRRTCHRWPLAGALALAWTAWVPVPARAAPLCKVSSPANALGSYSPSALKAAQAGTLPARAGFTCPNTILSLLSSGSIKARVNSRNGFKLQSGAGGLIGYSASADPNGTVPFSQNGTVDYMQNNLLNVLGLLGGSNVDLPFFVKPGVLAARPAIGTYTDQITIDWTWSLCTGGVNALGACLGNSESSTGQSIVTVTLQVEARDVTMSLTQAITWDPVNKAQNPRALPGSRRRLAVAVANPDIVTLDSGSLAVILPTPANLVPALDGDGASGTAAIAFSDGSPASALSVRYGGPGDTTDDVDFSADGGRNWTFVPTAGDLASEAAVTQIRVRPRGAMAKQSSFSVSASYLSR